MPSPQDLIYKQAFDLMMKEGYSQRDAETAGAEAVRFWRRNTRAGDAMQGLLRKLKRWP